MQPLKIFPSLAAANLLKLGEEVEILNNSFVDGIHFDVMDGHFVPLLTIGVPFLEQIRLITKHVLDVHIMVSNPENVYQDYLNAGADVLTFHPETAQHAHRLCLKIKESGKKAGIALNPASHWKTWEYLLPDVDQVTIMTVNPGFSRQKYIASMEAKMTSLLEFCKIKNLSLEIQVDGGVGLGNIGFLNSLGVHSVVAGGAVFNGGDVAANVSQLKQASTQESV